MRNKLVFAAAYLQHLINPSQDRTSGDNNLIVMPLTSWFQLTGREYPTSRVELVLGSSHFLVGLASSSYGRVSVLTLCSW